MPGVHSVSAVATANRNHSLQVAKGLKGQGAMKNGAELALANTAKTLQTRNESWSDNLTRTIADGVSKAQAGIAKILKIVEDLRAIATDSENNSHDDVYRSSTLQTAFNEVRSMIDVLTGATRDLANNAILEGVGIGGVGGVRFGALANQAVAVPVIDVQAATLGIAANTVATTVAAAAAITALDTAASSLSRHAAVLSTYSQFMENKSSDLSGIAANKQDIYDSIMTPQLDKISASLSSIARATELALAAASQASKKDQNTANSAVAILS